MIGDACEAIRNLIQSAPVYLEDLSLALLYRSHETCSSVDRLSRAAYRLII